MKRKAPPPRPRGIESPNYIKPDGTCVIVVQPQEPSSSEKKRRTFTPVVDPGPDLTSGEQLLTEFLEAAEDKFSYTETEDGELRQYWCPYCDEITAAIRWHCESCGEWFHAGDIDDQVEKPDVRIPYDLVRSMCSAFHDILYGADARDALALKGRRRTSIPQYHMQRYAASLVTKYKVPLGELSMTAACEKVAGELVDRIGEKDGRTIENWYKKFFPSEK